MRLTPAELGNHSEQHRAPAESVFWPQTSAETIDRGVLTKEVTAQSRGPHGSFH